MIPYCSYLYGRQSAGTAGVSQAVAYVRGGTSYPSILGIVTFTEVQGGTVICANMAGLPPYRPAQGEKAPIGPHGFHIHDGGSCAENHEVEPFKAAGGHWNPDQQPHGNHAGDFPVLFSNHGVARMCFFTDRFSPADVIGKTVIIHENPDDYRSQPAGNSGKRIACGVIGIQGQRI